MAETTAIEWTDHTFNPWIGCTKVAPGCANCYAEVQYTTKMRGVKWGPNGTRSKTSEQYWKQPLAWNKKASRRYLCERCGGTGQQSDGSYNHRTHRYDGQAGDCRLCGATGYLGQINRPRIFCASLADVFEDWDGPIVDHRGQVLWFCGNCGRRKASGVLPIDACGPSCCGPPMNPLTMSKLRNDLFRLIDATPHLDWLLLTKRPENIRKMWPCLSDCHIQAGPYCSRCQSSYRDNVWLLTSVSEQESANRNIPELLKCRDLSPVLGCSYEPALGMIDFMPWLAQLDWLIAGGESGPNARVNDVTWFVHARRQCASAGVAFFLKQFGSNHWAFNVETNQSQRVPFNHKKGGDISEFPKDLRVREFPVLTTEAAESAE